MPTINLAHERFISEMILYGDRLRAYLAAYPGCSEKWAVKSASRLLSNPVIKDRIREAVLAVQHEVADELREQLRGQAMTVVDKRLLLAKLVRGQLKTTKNVVRYNKEYELQIAPQHRDILSAIRLDMQLANSWKREFDVDDV